jgi:hypothetical protein
MCRCKQMLKEFADWSQGDAVRTGPVEFPTITWQVSNFLISRNFLNPNGTRSTAFGQGHLELDPTKRFLYSPPGGITGRPPALPGKLYFQDRFITIQTTSVNQTATSPCDINLVGIAPSGGGGPSLSIPNTVYTGPFCAHATNSIRLQIDIETGQTTYFDLTANVTSTLNLRCANGVLYGFSNETTQVPWACIISLTKGKYPGPEDNTPSDQASVVQQPDVRAEPTRSPQPQPDAGSAVPIR